MIEQAFGAYRAVVADLTKESKAEAWAEVADCLKEFETSSGFATELQFAICAGAKTGWVLDIDRAARLVLSDWALQDCFGSSALTRLPGASASTLSSRRLHYGGQTTVTEIGSP